MCGFLEKRLRDRQTDRQTDRERDETVFNGPNCPVGVGPKIRKFQCAISEKIWHFLPFWPNFWTDAAQNDQFSSFPEKNKNVTFLHSLRLAFMQKIREIQWAVF